MLCKAFERICQHLGALFDGLFRCKLLRVMAAEAARDEDHAGGANGRHVHGIVPGAGRHPFRGEAERPGFRFDHGLNFFIKIRGRSFAQHMEFHGNAREGRIIRTFPHKIVHALHTGHIRAAKIHGEGDLAGYHVSAAGVNIHFAHGGSGIAKRLRQSVEAFHKHSRTAQRIHTGIHGGSACVIRTAFDRYMTVVHGVDTGDDADLRPLVFKHGPLLDVKFHKGMKVALPDGVGRNGIGIVPRRLHGIVSADAAVILCAEHGFLRKVADQPFAAKKTVVEA